MAKIKRKCDVCPKEYMADTRNLKRGWGKCCSKSCAAKKWVKSESFYAFISCYSSNVKIRY